MKKALGLVLVILLSSGAVYAQKAKVDGKSGATPQTEQMIKEVIAAGDGGKNFFYRRNTPLIGNIFHRRISFRNLSAHKLSTFRFDCRDLPVRPLKCNGEMGGWIDKSSLRTARTELVEV